MTKPSVGRLSMDLLADSDLFRGLPPRALADIAQRASVVAHRRGGRIFLQGQPVAHAHLVLQGQVKIVQSSAAGEQVIVRLVRPGETFGTVGLYVDSLYPAEAVALSEVMEARWPARPFTLLVKKYPEIALNLVRLIGARLQEVQARLRELSTERVEQRVASVLLHAALRDRRSREGVRLPLSRRDIAELAGTTMYTASRVLSAWQRSGIAMSGRASVTILKPDALAGISSGGRAK
jgi:CRP-like cAMP-binding protein